MRLLVSPACLTIKEEETIMLITLLNKPDASGATRQSQF
jgi:hypothetical protein